MFVAVGLGLLTWIVGIVLWILVFGAAVMSNM
jgi:type IV secretory pathway TrbD component